MHARWTVLAGALALALAAPQATAAATPDAPRQPRVHSDRGADAKNGLNRLRADATGKLRIHRASDGAVDYVSSTNGRAMLEDSGTHGPARTVTDQLAKYGEAFGIDGALSRTVVQQTVGSSTGGSVVRSGQVVDGVPVFGGQVVMSLDEDQGVVSVDAATTEATEVPSATVSEARARRSAVAVTAKSHHVNAQQLTASGKGRRLYDPAIVHTADPMGVRPVWEFEVTNGFDIRETVLVGTGRGEIALHFNDVPEISRRVCDNANARRSSAAQVPICATAARSEGGAASSVLDVNRAYNNLGATSQAYADLDGIDLTALIGATVSGLKRLQSTVRWCFDDADCPYANAFWDGRQMVFGAGYAGADDVVGHELTHGYVERTSGLFAIHQSGAINESVSDVIGEIVDHRNPASAASDAEWGVGEDIAGSGPQRSLKDPTIFNQPDKMTSPKFVTADAFDDDGDAGAVHANDGVGNKTAYLVSQGGTFNGQTITGIDTGDPGLAKTGRLWLEAIPRLTSGSEYADLGRVLGTTCDELAGAGTGGFTSTDCESVRSAVAATELSTPPTDPGAAAAEAPISCPSGSGVNTLLARDDDGINGFEFDSTSPLWSRANGEDVPSYAVSGKESLFGIDPDPSLGDPASGSVTSAPFTVPTASGGTYLNFHHAYVMESYDSVYVDGGQAIVSKLVNGAWTPVNGLPWVNGPSRHIAGNTAAGFTGFGGDSHGYGSSQVDLSSLAGQRVQVSFRVAGDSDVWFYGWWIDDVRLYACDTATIPPTARVAPTAPTSASSSAGTTSAVISWQPPADRGTSPVASYRITRSDGKVNTAAGTARSINLTGLTANTSVTVSVAAVNQDGLTGPKTSVPIYGSTTTVTSSTTRAVRNRAFTVTGKVVRRGTSSLVSGMSVTLQRRVKGTSVWHGVSSGTTSAKGVRSWSVKQSAATYYRVISRGVRNYLGSTSAIRLVYKR